MHPGDRSVTIYRLENSAYGKPLVYGVEDQCSPLAFPELVIAVADIFVDLPALDASA